MTIKNSNNDIVRTTLAVIFIGILISASFWILRPFLSALIWATMIVITTWPFMEKIQEFLWRRRGVAVTVMTVMLLLIFIIPFTFAIVTVVDRSDQIVVWTKSLSSYAVSPPPPWVEGVPVVGPKLAERWHNLAAADQAQIAERLSPYVKQIAGWLMARTGSIMLMMVEFLLTVIISAVLYASGDSAARGIRLFARRLGGKNGEDAVILAAKAVRGVALGVVVTALVQSFLGGIGLMVAGVPAVAVLTAIIFILCIAQMGPVLVLIPVIVWLYWQGQNMWGTLMIIWTVFVGTIDNFIRPVLIKKGADLPLILIFAGVIGGLIAFGVIGLFIGPVMLAVTYTLLEAWVSQAGEGDSRPEER